MKCIHLHFFSTVDYDKFTQLLLLRKCFSFTSILKEFSLNTEFHAIDYLLWEFWNIFLPSNFTLWKNHIVIFFFFFAVTTLKLICIFFSFGCFFDFYIFSFQPLHYDVHSFLLSFFLTKSVVHVGCMDVYMYFSPWILHLFCSFLYFLFSPHCPSVDKLYDMFQSTIITFLLFLLL